MTLLNRFMSVKVVAIFPSSVRVMLDGTGRAGHWNTRR